jgi:hypothetical protein
MKQPKKSTYKSCLPKVWKMLTNYCKQVETGVEKSRSKTLGPLP